MKIAFANSIADLALDTKNADANAILETVGLDSRIGKKCLKPGEPMK